MRSAFPPYALRSLDFVSARTMKWRGRRSHSGRQPRPASKAKCAPASVSPSRPARPFYNDFAGLSGMGVMQQNPNCRPMQNHNM
jgi:hypothetical protein